MVQFVEHRIADRRLVGRMQKWLKAGCRKKGSGLASAGPYLPAVCLRHLGEPVAEEERARDRLGVRYADDIVLGFEPRTEAEAFLEPWRERMRKFGLGCTHSCGKTRKGGWFTGKRR